MRRVFVGAALVAVLLVWGCGSGSSPPPEKGPVGPEVDLTVMAAFDDASFRMGWPDAVASAYGDAWFEDQQPEHDVVLARFFMDRHEVTVAGFSLFLTYAAGALHYHPDQPVEIVRDGYLPVPGTENQPMRQVTWQAAADYCAWAGKRLPTEAEWEFAAAGTEKRPFPWGDDGASCTRAVYFTGSAFCAGHTGVGNRTGPSDVGSRPDGATPEGLMDMAGNVAEWTQDWYGRYPPEPRIYPSGPAEGTLKVVRGGGFLDDGLWIRTHARWGAPPDGRSANIGFRCVWSYDEPFAVTRGTLVAPEDVDRQPTDRPLAPGAIEPEVLVEGLDRPGVIRPFASGWAVAEAGAGRVVTVDGTTFEVTELVGGLDNPNGLAVAGDDLFVSDRGTGEIWRVEPGGATTLVTGGQDDVQVVVADAAAVFWATSTALRRATLPSMTVDEPASGLDGVRGLALSPTHVYMAEIGAADPAAARVARVSRSGGGVETLAGSPLFGTSLYPIDVALSPSGRVYFPLRLRTWPTPGLTCSTEPDGSDFRTHGYTPPAARWIAASARRVLWTTSYTLTWIDPSLDEPFQNEGPWTRPGGLLVTDQAVVWTDQHAGRILRVQF